MCASTGDASDVILPWLCCGRNLTTDNWFTSKPPAEKLVNRRTTFVENLKANVAKCLPPSAKSTDGRNRFLFLQILACLCKLVDSAIRPRGMDQRLEDTRPSSHWLRYFKMPVHYYLN